MPPRVSSEKTTPKPKVSSGALRSQTVTSWAGSSCFISAARYRPPGPPPAMAILMALPSGLDRDVRRLRAGHLAVAAGSSGFLADPATQLVVLELAAAVARQGVGEPDVAGVLVRRQLPLDVVLDLRRHGGVADHPVPQHDERADHRAALRGGARHDR